MTPWRKTTTQLIHSRLPGKLWYQMARNEVAELPQNRELAYRWAGLFLHTPAMWQVEISPSITTLSHPLLPSTCLLYGMAVMQFLESFLVLHQLAWELRCKGVREVDGKH